MQSHKHGASADPADQPNHWSDRSLPSSCATTADSVLKPRVCRERVPPQKSLHLETVEAAVVDRFVMLATAGSNFNTQNRCANTFSLSAKRLGANILFLAQADVENEQI